MVAKTNTPVIIVGAGPVGLFLALRLANAGIKVTVLEKEAHFDQSPRAIIYFAAVLDEVKKEGILEDLLEAGEKNHSGCDWRDASANILASATPPPDDPHFGISLGQPEFCDIVCKKLLETGNAQVLLKHAYSRHEQQEDGTVRVWVDSSSGGGSEALGTCQYLVGTDGGRSSVRKALGIDFQGFTWENVQMVACNFTYPLDSLGWKKANYLIDSEKWGVIVKRGRADRWRFAAGVSSTSETAVLTDEMIDEVKSRLNGLLPGDTSKIQWEAIAPYKVHQRCAITFRKGNVLLAGDAAHVNNPLGALGLTTGLLDAAHLGGDLKEILLNSADQRILDRYAEVRRDIWRYRTNVLSSEHMLRARATKPEDIAKRDDTFKAIQGGKNFATLLPLAMPDYALSSTSETTFPPYEEIEWFITITKLDDWSEGKLKHEYKVVHADMAREGQRQGAPLKQYTQYTHLKEDVALGKRPAWNYITRLRWPSLFIVQMAQKDPGYQATAGSHVFCRLDLQQGTITRRIANFSKSADTSKEATVRVLLFHLRSDALDLFTGAWVEKRSAQFIASVKADDRAQGYTLWQDITPPNTDQLFKGSKLFATSKWHNFTGVEAFDFNDVTSAKAYLDDNKSAITNNGGRSIKTVVSEPEIIF